MNILSKFVILSAFKDSLSTEANMHRHAVVEETLTNNGYGFKQVEGVYKGTSELSYVVVYHTPAQYQFLLNLAKALEQECILDVDSQRDATLVYTTGDIVPIGRFLNVGEMQAKSMESYTRDGENYYACL